MDVLYPLPEQEQVANNQQSSLSIGRQRRVSLIMNVGRPYAEAETSNHETQQAYRRISRHEYVTGMGQGGERVCTSDPTTNDHAEAFIITPKWLKKCILDENIKAKTAPFLLCFAGLPDSKKSTALNQIMKNHFKIDTKGHNEERGIRFYDFAAVRRPPNKEIVYDATDSLVNSGYVLVVESAIEYLLRIRGQHIKEVHEPSCIPSDKVYFHDKELNDHLMTIFDNLSVLTCKKESVENVPIWNQSLASGISMINIWDIGLNKVAFYVLPLLAGLLYNSRSWLFFDLVRDLPKLYEPPDVPFNRYDSSRNDREIIMKWRARIHYLLRFAKLAQSNESRQKICKLIATYTRSLESKSLDEKIETFKNEAKSAATQMQVDDVIDIDNVIPFNPNDENIDSLNKLSDDIVHDQFERSIEMPLSFVFLRSFLCRKDESKLFITKKNLKQIAAKLRIANETFEKFCQLFTSFGSIIDVSLIDSSSDLIILKPVDFLHELDKLFYPSSDVDLSWQICS